MAQRKLKDLKHKVTLQYMKQRSPISALYARKS